MRNLFRSQRALCLARVEPTRALAEAEELMRGEKTSANMLYTAACVCALSSAQVKDDGERERYAGRAVTLLRQARDRGYLKDKAAIERLRKVADLDPVRQREDFQKLIAELEGATKK